MQLVTRCFSRRRAHRQPTVAPAHSIVAVVSSSGPSKSGIKSHAASHSTAGASTSAPVEPATLVPPSRSTPVDTTGTYLLGSNRLLGLVSSSLRATSDAFARLVACASNATASTSEPLDVETQAERLRTFLTRQPPRMSDMLRLIAILGDCSIDDKERFIQLGVLAELIAEINRSVRGTTSRPEPATVVEEPRRARVWLKRSDSNASIASNGVGYGFGATKSKWDIERAVEERVAQEEQLMWLLCALSTFLRGDALKLLEANGASSAPQPTLDAKHIAALSNCALFELLESYLTNDSVFDVSQHIDLYQALVELLLAFAHVPALLPFLIRPTAGGVTRRSIAKDLIPRFAATLNSYARASWNQATDTAFLDFIRRVSQMFELIVRLVRDYERRLPAEERVKTANIAMRAAVRGESAVARPLTAAVSSQNSGSGSSTLNSAYVAALADLQIRSDKLLDDSGKPIYGFKFKKELKSCHPSSSNSSKERTKRIAKELASMFTALPLNASNAIFVCMEETRCDMMKVLISGPDDTPYENGLFEFDIWLPSRYPNAPPKACFLTTGGGTIRFSPNLYQTGVVCLSLLGTWDNARREEKWSSLCSLLQVLVSIQSLIFVKQSYFNEPGYIERFQGTPKGDELSSRYNLQIQHATMMLAIHEQYKNPPPYFADIIKRHFWLKRDAIIAQARRWLADMQNVSVVGFSDIDDAEAAVFINPAIQKQNCCSLIDEFLAMRDPDLDS